MSRIHRLGRRAGQAAIAHDRARSLAATRVDWPLDPTDAAWLDAHLASCESCRSVAASYDADRLALRSLRDHQPEPPRDLWARTAAGIEGESASRRTRQGASTRRRSIPLGALSGVAVIVVVIGVSVLSGGFLTGRSGDIQGGNPPVAVVPTTPGATPMAVGAGSVEWVGTSSTGGLAYSTTPIDKVCPTDRQPECEPVNDRDSKQVDLSIRPKSISQSPVKNQAVVVGTDATGTDTVVVMALPTPQPTSTPVPSPTPVATASPSLTPEPTETPVASASAVASSEPAESASIEPSATPEITPPASVEPSVEPTAEATPILTPEPTVSANLAIISGVTVVGQSAAYSPDGAWFAFTARPSDGSEGPDIYVWRVGDQLAEVATSDHASVFASWAGDRLIGSRVATGATGLNTESFFIDPDSGDQSAMDGSLWRPAVDPDEHWAVLWDGTVTVGQDTKTPIMGDGSLVLRGFSDAGGVDTTGKPSAVVAKGPFAEFDVRWDETGSWFAVWVADGNDSSIGRLSLLQLDPVTGDLDRPHGAPRDMPALPGFSIANGRLAWATPPGQGGEGSRVQVVAWTDDGVGAVESGPVENVVVIH